MQLLFCEMQLHYFTTHFANKKLAFVCADEYIQK